MIRMPTLLLEAKIIELNSSILNIIREASLDGKLLSDIQDNLLSFVLSLNKPLDTKDQIYVTKMTDNGLRMKNTVENRVSIQVYEAGESVLLGTPLLMFMSVLAFHKQLIDRKASAYKISQVANKITELSSLPIIAAIMPSEVILLKEGSVYIKSLANQINLGSPYEGLAVTNIGAPTKDDIINFTLNKYVSNNPLILEQLINQLFSDSGSYDLSILFMSNAEDYFLVSPDSVYSFELTDSQIALAKRAITTGVSVGSYAYRLFDIGEMADAGGHLAGIKKYVSALDKLRGRDEGFQTLTEQVDSNLGYSLVDILVDHPGHALTVSRFMNAMDHYATYRDDITIKSQSSHLASFKWIMAMRGPVDLINLIEEKNLSYTKNPDGSFTFTLQDGPIEGETKTFNYRVEFSRPSVGAAIEELFLYDLVVLRVYFRALVGLTDTLYYIKNGGSLILNQDTNRYYVNTTGANLARFTKPYVKIKNSKVYRNEI